MTKPLLISYKNSPSAGHSRSGKTMFCIAQMYADYFGYELKIVPTLVRVEEQKLLTDSDHGHKR